MDMEMGKALGFADSGADEAQGQAVAAPETVEGVSEPAGAATPPPEAVPQDGQDAPPEAAIPAPQSREWNDAMKQARVSGKHEAEKAINDVYTARLAAAGINNPSTGKPFASLADFLDYSDIAAADNAGISVEQFRAQREEQERLRQEAAEASSLRAELGQVKMGAELAELKKQFPEIKAKNVLELGEDFIRLRAANVPPDVAYLAVKGAKDAKTKPTPPSMGGISQQAPERDYFTSEELDNLTPAQLENPAVLEKAMKSMELLSKKQ